jgi:hypothetical protein
MIHETVGVVQIRSQNAAIPNVANNLNRKGHTGRKESLVWLLLCCGFAFYALCVVEAALHLELLHKMAANSLCRYS